MAILIPENVGKYIRAKGVTRDEKGHFILFFIYFFKKGHFIIIKGSIYQQDVAILNIYAPNNRVSIYMY